MNESARSGLLRLSVAGLAAVAVFTVAPPASYAEDKRPCVSKVEYQSVVGAYTHGIRTRAQVEDRWEVHGYGLADVPGIGTAVVYPRCGYRLREAWVAVAYDPKTGEMWGAAYVKDDGATLHGHERS